MISRVRITNFKSIGEGQDGGPGVDIELRPLTFFVGPNGGGKSSILEAIALVSEYGRGPMLMEYSDADLPYRRDLQKAISVAVSFESRTLDSGENECLTLTLLMKVGSGIGHDLRNEGAPEKQRTLKDSSRERLGKHRIVSLIRGSRGNVSRESPRSEGIPQWWLSSRAVGIDDDRAWVGTYGEDLIPLLALIFGKGQHNVVREEITDAASHFGVSAVNAGWQGRPPTASDYEDPQLKVPLELRSASLGGRQALTVVTQVCWCPPGGLIMVEEPEISLHPEAQVKMCRFLARQAAKGKQVLATTHSPFMLLAMRKAVLTGVIAADDVAVYHIDRNHDPDKGEVGTTTARRLPLAREGYLEEWVPSFSKVERELAREWVAAIGEPEAQGKRPRRRAPSV